MDKRFIVEMADNGFIVLLHKESKDDMYLEPERYVSQKPEEVSALLTKFLGDKDSTKKSTMLTENTK